MAEYIEREAVFNSSNIIIAQTREYGSIEVVPVDCIADVPAADVVEVVRCKSCSKSIVSETGRRFCSAPLGTLGCVPVGDNDFCSRGERRDDHVAE